MAMRCENCQQPLPLRPGQSAQGVRCPWCGAVHGGPSIAIAQPRARASTLAAPQAMLAPRPDTFEVAPSSRRNLILGVLAVGVIGLLLSVGIVGLLWTSDRKPIPVAVIPPTGAPTLYAVAPSGDTEPGSDTRRTTVPDPRRVIRPRDGNPGIFLPQPGNDLGVPRMVDFMGSRASGRQICIIADRSGSMRMNRRIETLVAEIEKTLETLASDQQFYVLFFDSRAEDMPGKKWLAGGKDVEKILPWVRSQKPRNGTLPMPAFQIAFRLEPKPDLIFFMTDGIIPSNVPDAVARLNEGVKPKITINSILFGGEGEMRPAKGKKTPMRILSGEDQLRKLAGDSGGTYRFVPDKTGR